MLGGRPRERTSPWVAAGLAGQTAECCCRDMTPSEDGSGWETSSAGWTAALGQAPSGPPCQPHAAPTRLRACKPLRVPSFDGSEMRVGVGQLSTPGPRVRGVSGSTEILLGPKLCSWRKDEKCAGLGLSTWCLAPWRHARRPEVLWTLPQPALSFLGLLGVDLGLRAGDGSWRPRPAHGAGPGHGASLLDRPHEAKPPPARVTFQILIAAAFAPGSVPSATLGTEILGCSTTGDVSVWGCWPGLWGQRQEAGDLGLHPGLEALPASSCRPGRWGVGVALRAPEGEGTRG